MFLENLFWTVAQLHFTLLLERIPFLTWPGIFTAYGGKIVGLGNSMIL